MELLTRLLKLDIIYTFFTKATDIGASGSSNRVIDLKDIYMQVIYA